jgi:MFS family permease
VLGQTALIAGFTLTAMVLGWPIGATIAARNFTRFGLRPTLLFGAILLPIGALVFLLLSAATPVLVVGAGSVVMGLGMGFLSVTAIMIIQGSVGWAERGSATASNIFARNLGSTLGATALGAVFNVSLSRTGGADDISFEDITQLLQNPAALLDGPAARQALGSALHWTFSGIFVIALITLLVAVLVPNIAQGEALPAGDETDASLAN